MGWSNVTAALNLLLQWMSVTLMMLNLNGCLRHNSKWFRETIHPSIYLLSIRTLSKNLLSPRRATGGLGLSQHWESNRSHPGWFTEKQTLQIRAGGPWLWPLTLWDSLWLWFVLYVLSRGGEALIWSFPDVDTVKPGSLSKINLLYFIWHEVLRVNYSTQTK